VRVLQLESFAEIADAIRRTGCDPEGIGIMTRKGRTFAIALDAVPLKACLILKQEMLALGADAAHAREVASLSVEQSPVVLLGTFGQYHRLIPKLRRQPFHLAELARHLEGALRSFTATGPRRLDGHHRIVEVGGRCRVMGVVNVTPDSFSDGGAFLDPDAAIEHAFRLESEGADLIDVGAESTRPGASPVTPEAEWKRLAPVLRGISERMVVPISVDTRHPAVARRALDAGADLINDVGGLRDGAMRRLLARTEAPAVVMHMRGEPRTMQRSVAYEDVRAEVFGALAAATRQAEADGIRPQQLLVDPGLGFGKTAEQNWELLGHVGELRSLGYPVVIGASRKSFLGAVTGGAAPSGRVGASVTAAVVAALRGADVVRVHDVAPTVEALAVVEATRPVPASGRLRSE
jgi:dihydropteroate synthase